jgi:ABC-type glutathione transport system ATPase component
MNQHHQQPDQSPEALAAQPANQTTPLLKVDNLRVSFRINKKESVETVRGISFEIPRNATVALVGESGSGKSVSSLACRRKIPLSPHRAVLFLMAATCLR